ncbi:LytR/AlgR family response regulator transcription factor [Blautia sp. MSJ-19]|uniref:LytR/AlgR family response regulator transcription factor n=1 Tax=Blautia sp. MSJ-19 TaxID=2841517 RepID=UPI001C0F1F5E|nr:LytTR family DNA-binding domain-containing protein [Blautia sp. MSJ-19]MBU5481395.1 LytTR family DNA-binding domain-containing protein [Blautia sp. MSJ-19]
MKKIVICEDSEIDREILKSALNQYFSEINEELELIEYISADAMIADVEEGYAETGADVLFLDIYMEGLNGMQAAHKLRALRRKIPIIFLTASPDFAVESYEVRAAGYLLKPFEESKLRELLSRILQTERKRRIAVKVGRQYRYPYTDDVMYIESRGHVVKLHLKDGTEISSVEKLNDIEKRISEKRFLRCNQSYLVNMDFIRDVQKDSFVMQNEARIPVRVRGKKNVFDSYNEYFVNNFAE